MTREELKKQVGELAKEVFQKPSLEIMDSLCSEAVDTWTSMSFMRLLTVIENKYGFKYRIADLLKMKKMGDIIDVTYTHIV